MARGPAAMAKTGHPPWAGVRRAAGRARRVTTRPGWTHGWLGGVALGLLSCVVTLGLIEAALRWIPVWSRATTQDPRFQFNPYRPDGQLGFVLQPGVRLRHVDRDFSVAIAVNALGMRGPERDLRKPPGSARILLLGDSFAFGWGVEQAESFGARLESLLADRVGPVEVWSAAVPGWTTDQHYLYLRTRGLALDPDLVLLATGESDLGELGFERLVLDEARLPVRVEPMFRMIDATGRMRYLGHARGAMPREAWPGEGFLQDHSRLYHWARFRLAKISAALAVRRAQPPMPEWLRTDPGRSIISLGPDDLQRALATSSKFRLRYHLFLVDAMEREARAQGALLRTLLIAHSGETRPADPELAGLHDACAARPEVCLDSARVIPAAETARFTFAHDPHWNAEGHRRIAEALAVWLAGDPTLRRAAWPAPTGVLPGWRCAQGIARGASRAGG
jgi:lysophospholipase L1-like esterase